MVIITKNIYKWVKNIKNPNLQIFVVHGEAGAAESFSDSIVAKLGWKSKAPKDGEQVDL